jgi:hypothetical protein
LCQALTVERASQRNQEPLAADRFLEEVMGAAARGAERGLDRAMAAHHQDRHVFAIGLDQA